ncbi:MAG: TolC family protein [Mariprofundus sp.]|nr:TolC family protein [Mariprofundus sp.]
MYSFTAWGEELTLSSAVSLAMEHAPAMKAIEAERDASEQDYYIARSGLLPRIDITVSHQRRKQRTRYDQPRTIFEPNLKYHDTTAALRMVQPLFNLERWAGYRQGEISAETGEMKLRLERQRLILEVAQAYLKAVTAQSALHAASAKEEAAEKLAAQAQAKFEAGVSPINDQLDADARRDLARAEKLDSENNFDQAKAKLASLAGVMPKIVLAPLISGSISTPAQEDLEDWELQAVENSLSVKLARLQFNAAEQGELKAWGSGLPNVELFASLDRNRATSGQLGTGTRTRNYAVGVQVSVPLFAGGGDLAQLRKSKMLSIQAEYSLQDDIRLARLTARQAFLGYSSAISKLHAMRKSITSTEEAANAARMGHQVGLRTISEVLDADERILWQRRTWPMQKLS